MSKQIEAMKQALDALEYTTNLSRFLLNNEANIGPMLKADDAITALREALAEQPAQQSAERGEPLTDALWGLLDAIENELNRRAIPEVWLLMAHKAGRAYIEAAHGITGSKT